MKRRRSGYTLLEIVAVIGMTGALLTMAARCFHLVILQAGISRELSDNDRHWQRLAEAYRRDVHAARRAETNADGSELRLFLPDDHVARYASRAEGVERTETGSERKALPVHYRLRDGKLHFSVNSEKTRALLVYSWMPPESREARDAGQSPPSHELRLEANIGSDLRFSSPR
jgi:type II secretory pathway component PulJ